jgi:hypothetical protein
VGGQKNFFFSLLFFFWVVGCSKALKKSEIGLGLSHYFYYQPVLIINKNAFFLILIEKKIKFFKIKYFLKIYLFSLSFPNSKKSALGRKQTFMIKILDRIDEKSATF